ncbi:glycosyltransferase family 4 protein [Staphylococcus equorum]|uniref:glycosyltransferase family 4 protein n=1 Tax=Staphylococcus equorum TaxID=246432 RepID=UPI002DBB8E08|nr:glycosyltransferase family 4 protein [Staphylococcus equorum]MEB7722866.1 glycosyltransferase family 4 protein [Staphylococcus equorum]
MKLVYLSSSTLFSKSANSLHVMKMSNSFSKIIDSVDLVVRDSKSLESPFDFYQVEETFEIKNKKVNKYKIFGFILFALKNYIHYKKELKDKNVFFYGRDILTLSLFSLFSSNVGIELHSIPTSKLKNKLLEFSLKKQKIKKIVVISNALKADLKNFFDIDEKNIIVAHDGADIHKMTVNEKPNKIGYVGSINKGRGIELILELALKHPNLEFNIIGGTLKDLNEKLNIYNVPGNVKLLGYLSQKEIEKYINEFYIVLAPYQTKVGVSKKNSDTSRWMSPIKLFEYMSFGKAIIVSDLTVLREIITNNYNGVFVNPENINEWSENIELLIENKVNQQYLKENALKTLKKYFTWDKRAEDIFYNLMK